MTKLIANIETQLDINSVLESSPSISGVSDNVTNEERTIKENPKIKRLASRYIMAKSYISASMLILEQTIRSKKNDYTLIFPAYYNIRHGLEIILKQITRKIEIEGNKEEENKLNGHNIVSIYSNLKKNKNLQKKDYKSIKNILTSIKPFIEKYGAVGGLEKIIGESIMEIQDPQNEFFRYPEHNNITINVDYGKLTEKISMSDLIVMKDDCDELIKLIKDLKGK